MIKLVDLGRMIEAYGGEYRVLFDALLKNCDFVKGAWIERLEEEWKYTVCGGMLDCVAVSSGTSALELIFEHIARERGAGSVLVPAMTFFATVEAVVRAGHHPVLVDVDDRGLIDMDDARRKCHPGIVALVFVDLYGQVPDLAEIERFREDFDVVVVEDAAQAHGSLRVGRVADAVAWSFYPGKTVPALGDAGMIAMRRPTWAAAVRRMRDHGRESKYGVVDWGTNARMDTLQAGIVGVNVLHMPALVEGRRSVYECYVRELNAIEVPGGLNALRYVPFDDDEVSHLFVVHIVGGRRDQVFDSMREAGIQVGVHYRHALHQHAAWKRRFRMCELPRAEDWAETCLSLPMHPWLTDDEIRFVVHELVRALS